MKRGLPKTWWSRLLLILATYILAADILPNMLLILADGVGYLPYSDRPGPGWHVAHVLSFQEVGFYAGFALLLLRGTTLCGATFSVSGLVLGFCALPRWVVRLMAVPAAFLASGFIMAAAGWYIAISALGVYAAAGCGALWGFFVFPRLIPQLGKVLPTSLRIAVPIVMFLGAAYWLIRPLLPDPGLTNAKVEVIRRDDKGADLATIDLSFVGSSIGPQVKGSGKYVSTNRMQFATDGRNQVRVLLIIDDDRPVPHTFVLPRSGDAIYRQQQGQWREERIEARRSEISLNLTSPDGRGIGLGTQGPCCSSMSESFGQSR